MNISSNHIGKTSAALSSLLLLSSLSLYAQEPLSPQPPPIPQDDRSQAQEDNALPDAKGDAIDGATPMMQGPLHEAYAEQFSDNPEPSQTVTKQPPEPINEQPPAYKPEGDNIQWIPGYWGWDIESEDFIWVSGIWRQVPPDQQWIPGYWAEVEGGWQWVSGFWNALEDEEIAYLPPPPASIDNGPSEPAPDDNHFWIAGCWQYDQSQYAWQSGYWAPANQDWVWVPNRYVWTPSGYIYRTGYWDYAFLDRGTVFCPVYFPSGYQQAYQPSYCIELSPLWFASLFVSPSYNHYYYGNYYGYSGRNNIYPWVNYHQRTQAYDPLYSYYAYQGGNANWLRQLTRLERQYETGNIPNQGRPTVAAYLRNQNNPNANRIHAASIQSIAQRQDTNFSTPFSYRALDARVAKELQTTIDPMRRFTQDRAQLERANNDIDKRRTARVDGSKNQNSATEVDPLKTLKVQSNKVAGNISAATGIRAETNSQALNDNREQANRDRSSDARRDRDENPNSPKIGNNRQRDDANKAAENNKRDDTDSNLKENPAQRPNRNPNLGQDINKDNPSRVDREGNEGPSGKDDSDKNPNRNRSESGNIQRDLENRSKLPNQLDPKTQKDNVPGGGSGNPSLNDPSPGKATPDNKPQTRNQNPINRIQEGLGNQPLGQDEMKQLRDQMRSRGNNPGNANKGLQVGPGPSSPQRNDPRTMRPSMPKAPAGGSGAVGANPSAGGGQKLPANPLGNPGAASGGNPGGAGGGPKLPANPLGNPGAAGGAPKLPASPLGNPGGGSNGQKGGGNKK